MLLKVYLKISRDTDNNHLNRIRSLVKRKIEKHRQKVLRVDSVLQKNPFVQIVPSSKSKPKKSIKKQKDVLKENDATVDCPKDGSVIALGMLDIWANDEGDNKSKKVSKPSVIPAVEVEAPGCSVSSMEVITFEPAPTQVLLSEEINGSLRKLKEIEDRFTFKAGGHLASDKGYWSILLEESV
ncbi:hypothetical protein Q3G72_024830 [Acer saccharum]|nr:hypothetical protein Q3G72_024830 [Acer saccharum]